MRLLTAALACAGLFCCALTAGCPKPQQDAPADINARPLSPPPALDEPAATEADATDGSAEAGAMPATLAESLRKMQSDMQGRMEPAMKQPFDDEIAALNASGMLDKLPATAPMFTLKDKDGNDVVPARLLAQEKILVVQFYRGEWCPVCGEQLRWLNSMYDEFTAAGAEIIAVTPEKPEYLAALVDKLALRFPLVSDPGSAVAEKYGVAYEVSPAVAETMKGFGMDLTGRNADGKARLPLAATFVIDKQGNIIWKFADGDYWKRSEPSEVLKAVQAERARYDAEMAATKAAQ